MWILFDVVFFVLNIYFAATATTHIFIVLHGVFAGICLMSFLNHLFIYDK